MESNGRWLSAEQISEHLGVSRESIYRWLESKKIPAHRLGRLWKFQKAEVDEWVKRGGASPDKQHESASEK